MAIEVPGMRLGATDPIQQLGDAVVGTDLDGKITLFNAAAEQLYGWSACEVVGESIAMLTPEATAEEAREERGRVLTGETRQLTHGVVTRSGEVCTVELTLAPLRDAGGSIVGTIGTAREATSRMLRERQYEFMSRLVGETETVAVIGTDRAGLITVFNRGAEELLGYTAEETIGRLNAIILFDPEELERRAAEYGGASAFQRALDGELEEGIWTYVCKDGHKIEVWVSFRAIFNRVGEIEGFLRFVPRPHRDAPVEDARLQAEERFRIAFEHAPIGLAIASLEGPTRGHWTQTNPALARMLGWNPGELDGAVIDDMTHPEDRRYTAGFLKDLRSQKPIVVEKRFARKNGSFMWAYVARPRCRASTEGRRLRRHAGDGYQRAAPLRAAAPLHGRPRSAHGPLQPPPLRIRLERVITAAHADDEHAALLILDLDGFKTVNDRFGHSVGDELVTHIGGLLRRSVRKSDFVSRLVATSSRSSCATVS